MLSRDLSFLSYGYDSHEPILLCKELQRYVFIGLHSDLSCSFFNQETNFRSAVRSNLFHFAATDFRCKSTVYGKNTVKIIIRPPTEKEKLFRNRLKFTSNDEYFRCVKSFKSNAAITMVITNDEFSVPFRHYNDNDSYDLYLRNNYHIDYDSYSDEESDGIDVPCGFACSNNPVVSNFEIACFADAALDAEDEQDELNQLLQDAHNHFVDYGDSSSSEEDSEEIPEENADINIDEINAKYKRENPDDDFFGQEF